MKVKRPLLPGIILGALIGWALGFLRFPYVETNLSFLVGFIAGLGVVSLGIILVSGWKANTSQHVDSASWKYTLAWALAAGFILVASLVLYRQNKSLNMQAENQQKKMRKLSELMEYVKKDSRMSLINNMVDHVGEELKRNQDGTLSDSTIASIAALSFSCKPYEYVEGDSLSEKKLSPERGQLLLALFIMQINSGSFAKIKLSTSFSGADLREAELKGADLSGADLRGANLKNADLRNTNLNGADLRNIVLWGANLNKSNLTCADMKRADLRWAQLNGVDLKLANLNGAYLTNAQLMNADMSGATVQWAQSDGALLNEADLTGVDFFGTDMTKANLSNANLSNTNLRTINLSEADLTDATLNKAVVDKNWLEKLSEWRLPEVKKSYQVVNDSTDKWKNPIYRLKKIKDEAEVEKLND